MFNTMNPSTKSIMSQIMKGAIVQISTEDSTANYNKMILVLDGKLTISEECKSLSTNEHLKRPTVKSISKAEALSLIDKYRNETVIHVVDEDVKDDYTDSVVELKEGDYEY